MRDISLEGMVDKPRDSDGVLIFDRQPTLPKHTTIDGIAAENITQPIQLGNETARERLAGFYERVRGAVSRIKPKSLRGFRRAALPVTLAGVLAACSVAATSNPYMLALNNTRTIRTSQGAKVAYPPDFTCARIASEVGDYYNPDGSKRTWSAPHSGSDILGKLVIAPADGQVLSIDYRHLTGYGLSMLHTPDDIRNAGIRLDYIENGVSLKDMYIFTFYWHLKERDGKNSALNYVKEGQRVVMGQPIAEVGKSGQGLANSPNIPEHVHWEIWGKRDPSYIRVEKGEEKYSWAKGSFLILPNDLWATHELDVPGKTKYIPSLKEGDGDRIKKDGFILPVLCPNNSTSLKLDGINLYVPITQLKKAA